MAHDSDVHHRHPSLGERRRGVIPARHRAEDAPADAETFDCTVHIELEEREGQTCFTIVIERDD